MKKWKEKIVRIENFIKTFDKFPPVCGFIPEENDKITVFFKANGMKDTENFFFEYKNVNFKKLNLYIRYGGRKFQNFVRKQIIAEINRKD